MHPFFLLFACQPDATLKPNKSTSIHNDSKYTEEVSANPPAPDNTETSTDSQTETEEDISPTEEDTEVAEKAVWTIMVYVNGDNDLEDAGLDDLNEMEQIGSTRDVNVIVQFDRSPEFSTAEDNWSGARRYRITQDEDPNRITSTPLANLGSVDSGSVETISGFVDWASTEYPAEKYALVLWNHGDGWKGKRPRARYKAISDDFSTGNSLSIANGDLQQLLQKAEASLEQPLNVLGMDACLMMSWEVATAAQPYANYLVASQDLEGFDGWDYTAMLEKIVAKPEMNGGEFGKKVAQTFQLTGDLTQSVLDLSQLPALNDSLNVFADAYIAEGNPNDWLDAIEYTYAGMWGYADEHDLTGLIEELIESSDSSAVKEAGESVLTQLENVIIANHTNNVKGANGLSIYAPGRYSEFGFEREYLQTSWAERSRWDDMLAFLYDIE